jgi:hypothetical protein
MNNDQDRFFKGFAYAVLLVIPFWVLFFWVFWG